MNVNPEDLLPKLPSPSELKPFPTTLTITYEGFGDPKCVLPLTPKCRHTDCVRCISVSPTGEYLASGSRDETLRFWEVSTGRCLKSMTVSSEVLSLDWNPNASRPIVSVGLYYASFWLHSSKSIPEKMAL